MAVHAFCSLRKCANLTAMQSYMKSTLGHRLNLASCYKQSYVHMKLARLPMEKQTELDMIKRNTINLEKTTERKMISTRERRLKSADVQQIVLGCILQSIFRCQSRCCRIMVWYGLKD